MSSEVASTTGPDFARKLIRYGMEILPNLIEHANGAVVRDVDGREILDFTSGQMCSTLGHNHPAIVDAIEKACSEAIHLFSGMVSVPVAQLSEDLAALLPENLQKMMFLNTGSESNEAALRMAKLRTGRFEVVALTGSFHGMTGAAVSSTYACGHQGYGPMLPGTMAIPAPNCYRCPIRHCRDTCDMTCLVAGFAMVDAQSVGSLAVVMAEPIQSTAGVIVPPPLYFKRLKEECERRGMLLILDEAQTALGRLGVDFAFQKYDIVPDFLTLSKTLGGGLPLAATVTSDEIEADCYKKGFTHVTSHVSDPLPAEIGVAVIRTLVAERVKDRVKELGPYLKSGLLGLQQKYEQIGDVRGEGLLLGVEFVYDREGRRPNQELGSALTRRCFELGLSVNLAGAGSLSAVWRIAPPLVVDKAHIDQALGIMDQALSELC